MSGVYYFSFFLFFWIFSGFPFKMMGHNVQIRVSLRDGRSKELSRYYYDLQWPVPVLWFPTFLSAGRFTQVSFRCSWRRAVGEVHIFTVLTRLNADCYPLAHCLPTTFSGRREDKVDITKHQLQIETSKSNLG